jgi:propanol-preferring alcohol dehydrogenase
MRGDVNVVGIAGGSYDWSFFSVAYEVSLQSTYWGSRPELEEVLDLGARGLIAAAVSRFSLPDAAEAYRRLAAGEIEGRAVVVANAS